MIKNNVKIESKKPKNKDIWIVCGKCNRETCHSVLYHVSVEEDHTRAGIKEYKDFFTVQCKGCNTVSFCEEFRCTEDLYENDQGGLELCVDRKLYPPRVIGRPIISYSWLLPLKISRLYTETHFALVSDSKILTSIGIRAIIETVCKDQKAKGKNLKEKINMLVTDGFITPSSAQLLQKLRFIGNKAAHEAAPHDVNVLHTAFDIVEHLMKEVYIMPQLVERLPKNGKE